MIVNHSFGHSPIHHTLIFSTHRYDILIALVPPHISNVAGVSFALNILTILDCAWIAVDAYFATIVAASKQIGTCLILLIRLVVDISMGSVNRMDKGPISAFRIDSLHRPS